MKEVTEEEDGLYSVVIGHDNGYCAYYSKIGSVSVDKGTVVTRSDVIGTIGGYQNNHVHFALINDDGRYIEDVYDHLLYREKP